MAITTPEDYTVAWICALPLEAAAAIAMLDKTHTLTTCTPNSNAYEYGELNGHFIVIAHLPHGVYGTVSASAVASRIRLTFPRIQFALMVGIGGGVPGKPNDIRLGDVVVSRPSGKHGGVIQYDYGKAIHDGTFEEIGILNKPPQALLTHMSLLEARHLTKSGNEFSDMIWKALERCPNMRHAFCAPDDDFLFHSTYSHVDKDGDCGSCDMRQLVEREPRLVDFFRTPRIHYGLIASGDQVMKDPRKRDTLAQQHGILCFEMEAAGLMDELPTLVIRGICDYCDSHKQKDWQGYAALAAAAYAKLLLTTMTAVPTDSENSKAPPKRHFSVPLPRNSKFVARQNEINRLEHWLFDQDGSRRVAVTGLGGVGKTQVALELAYRLRNRDKGWSIFWFACTSDAMIEQGFRKLAEALGLPEAKPVAMKEQIKGYFSSSRAGRWLLIFDNADDAETWLETGDAELPLADTLPENENVRILFTTRNRKLAAKLASFQDILPIPDADADTAVRILESALANQALLQDEVAAIALLKQLDFLPLAITQASAYITANGITPLEYLILLQEEEEAAVELLSEDFRDPGRYKDIQNSVVTTWLISFKRIRDENEAAADYLSFMACINPRNIPKDLLPDQPTKKRKTDALGLLSAYSFINSGQDASISMHRLVHIATRTWLKQNALFSHRIERAALRLEKAFKDADQSNQWIWRERLPHALTLMQEDEFIEQHRCHIDLLWIIARCHSGDGRHSEAEALYKLLLQYYEETCGKEHPQTLTTRGDLANVYIDQARWIEAEALHIRVLEDRKRILDDGHPDIILSMSCLAHVYLDQGRWDEAEKLEVQVFKTRKIGSGVEHPDTLVSMSNLASIYERQGRWIEAEKLHTQVLETRKRVLGAEHPLTLNSAGYLADVYKRQYRLFEAEKLEIEVLETRKKILGPEHPDTIVSMGNLAVVYTNQGKLVSAERLGKQVLEFRKRMLGPEHPHTLVAMENLAIQYVDCDKWDEARNLYIEVVATRRRVLGPMHPSSLLSISNLALGYWKYRELDEAYELFTVVLEPMKKVLGPEHPFTLGVMRHLSQMQKSHGLLYALDLAGQSPPVLREKYLRSERPDLKSKAESLAKWEDMYGICLSAPFELQETEPKPVTKELPEQEIATEEVRGRPYRSMVRATSGLLFQGRPLS